MARCMVGRLKVFYMHSQGVHIDLLRRALCSTRTLLPDIDHVHASRKRGKD